MAFQSGKRLGTYEILSVIGAGGMGEVYQAHDTKLGRDVAVKVLPPAFAYDPDRLSRFQREARMLAALNHPNIAAIYGLEDSSGTNYLVMELVPGETLADRIKREGKIPVDEALSIARQIAEALEAAHEKGIIHRDLKPANITITPEGKVKVLDFGLAKVFEDGLVDEDLNNSPTLTKAATLEGAILGTAAYMSPEQARGKTVDRRTDIWAFGCVLYEMLTGARLFEGETVSDIIAHVLTKQPDLEAIPQKFRPLLRSCLEKNPKLRLRDVFDGMVLLDAAPAEQPAAPQGAAALPVWLMGLAATACLAAVALAVLHFREKPAALPEIVRYSIRLPDKVTFTSAANFSLSPDRRHISFTAGGANGEAELWVQDLDGSEAHPIANTETGTQPPPTFWSPDSRYIAFSHVGAVMMKADIQTGEVEAICQKPGPPIGGSWNRDGTIIFGSNFEGLWKVSAAGGTPVRLTLLDASRKEHEHELPFFLPDGRHFLYLRVAADPELTGIYVGSIDDPPERQNEKLILKTGFGAQFVPSPDGGAGRLLFLKDGSLMAQGFDADKLEFLGSASTIADGVGSVFETGYFSARENILIYRPANTGSLSQYVWMDREGKGIGKAAEPGLLGAAQVSNDGKLLAYEKAPRADGDLDIWVLDIARDTSSRLTFGPGDSGNPVWSPDGREIAYSAIRDGAFDLYRKAANGSGQEELLFKSKEAKRPFSWSPDGRFLIFGSSPDRGEHENLWVLPMQGEHSPFPFSQSKFSETRGQFSPDGRWVAYESDETGRYEVYVKEFKDSPQALLSGGKWTISNDSGVRPRWRADGKELVFRNANKGTLMSVDIRTASSVNAGVPKNLFTVPGGAVGDTMTPDGQRFLYATPVEQNAVEAFSVVVNWPSALPH